MSLITKRCSIMSLVIGAAFLSGCSVQLQGEPQRPAQGVSVEEIEAGMMEGYLDKAPSICLEARTGFGVSGVAAKRVNRPSGGSQVTTAFMHCFVQTWKREHGATTWAPSDDGTPAPEGAYEKAKSGS